MLIFCSFCVAWSLALTCTMPLASISKVTCICGTPLGAGGIPYRSNCPKSLLSAANSLSPWKMRMETTCWLSVAVLKVFCFLVGMVEFLLIMRVKAPPSVSMPSDSGVTSSKTRFFTSP